VYATYIIKFFFKFKFKNLYELIIEVKKKCEPRLPKIVKLQANYNIIYGVLKGLSKRHYCIPQ